MTKPVEKAEIAFTAGFCYKFDASLPKMRVMGHGRSSFGAARAFARAKTASRLA
jgi:hypothetical protein